METSRYLVRGRARHPYVVADETRDIETIANECTPGTLHVTRVITHGCLRTGTFASHNPLNRAPRPPKRTNENRKSRCRDNERARDSKTRRGEAENEEEEAGGGRHEERGRPPTAMRTERTNGTNGKPAKRDDRRRARARRAAMAMRRNSKERAASWSTRPRLLDGMIRID